MSDNNINRLLIFEKPRQALIFLANQREPVSQTDLAKGIDAAVSYAPILSKQLEDVGIITRKEEGRKKFLILTDKGKAVTKLLFDFDRALKQYQ